MFFGIIKFELHIRNQTAEQWNPICERWSKINTPIKVYVIFYWNCFILKVSFSFFMHFITLWLYLLNTVCSALYGYKGETKSYFSMSKYF